MLVGACVSGGGGGGGEGGAVSLTLEIRLKEQYPVTVHEPNLDFLTGCRKFKRCKAEFDTTAVH